MTKTYEGACHCGRLRVRYTTQLRPEAWQLRACGCSFCRRHGARTTTDPAGLLHLEGEARKYRFGLATADFHLCPECGVYMAAVLTAEGGRFATLNVNTLEIGASLTQAVLKVGYGDETAVQRVARRSAAWTPVAEQ